MKRGTDKIVSAALRRVWPDPATVDDVQIRAISGGVSPRTFLTIAGNRHYVLRMPTTGSVALLDIDMEAHAMRVAAAANLAPAVVAVDSAAGLLLTEYRVMPWINEMFHEPIPVATIARALRALHALPVELPVIAIKEIALRYLDELDAHPARPMGADDRHWGDELLRLAHDHEAKHAPTAFCHNDLVASNILTDGASAQFVDFEYAGRGAALLDLASLAGMNSFTESQRRLMLAEYYGEAAVGSLVSELDKAIRMVRLLAYFWARLTAKRVGDGDAYRRYAAEMAATLK